ncbi:molecular chaperone TorD family protein, partial [Halogeometricum sp. CBA1124]|uniref:molecular chaperone TorD family protein n=1 Tax=Halogeometricum sp. CBA1124 TaxID=2668071 RepID=UPI00142BD42F
MSAAAPSDDLPATDPAVCRTRARVYDLLAACLDGDVDAFVAAAERGDFARLSSSLPVDLDAEFADDYDREALSVGYDNLFVVPGAHYVPPFASAHATEPSTDYESDSAYHAAAAGGELLGEPAAAVARLYGVAGFEPTRGDGIPDHVAATFEFLGTLAAAEADRREAGAREAADALRELQRRALAATRVARRLPRTRPRRGPRRGACRTRRVARTSPRGTPRGAARPGRRRRHGGVERCRGAVER